MDTAAAVLIVKGAMVLFGVAVVLRLLVKEYERMADVMADEIARAALKRGQGTRTDGAPEPHVTLSPASDAHQ